MGPLSLLCAALLAGAPVLVPADQGRSHAPATPETNVPSPPTPPDAVAPPAGSALPVLREMLHSDTPECRIEGIEMLMDVPTLDGAEIKLDALLDPDPAVRDRAIQSLTSFPDDALCTHIVYVLEAGPPARIAALDQTLPLLRQKLERPLLAMLRDPALEPERRVVAAYALGRAKSALATETLAALAWEEDPLLALASVQALARAADPKALPYLNSMLGHSSEDIRWEAVHALGALRGPAVLEALAEVATTNREPNAMIRKQAVLYLAASDDAAAIPLLIRCMEYSHALREVSGEALRQLTGKRYRGNSVEWRRWYEDQRRVAQSPEELLASYQRAMAASQQPQVDVEWVP